MAELDLEHVTRLTLELVAQASVTGQEHAVADLVEQRCRAMPGVRLERIGNSIVARSGPDGAGALALVGHLDTVPAWPGHQVYRDGSRVVGRGASDMKCGDAALLAVLEFAAPRRLPLVAVLYEREEGPNELNGIHRVLANSSLLGRPIFAFVLEPTAEAVLAGCVGCLPADVVFRGRTGHSARPWEAENAILAAAPFLNRAAEAASRPHDVEGLVFYDTVAVVSAHAGIASNVIPDEFVIGLDVRFAPGRDVALVQAEVEALAGPGAEVRWIGYSPAAEPNLTHPLLRRFVEKTGAPVRPKQAWTDVATLAARGIPATNYGPGDPAQAHQPGEWVDCAAVERVARTLAGFVQETAAAAGTPTS